MIYRNPKAIEGSTLTLSQKDLILAYLHLDNDIADVVWKYYVPHASQWLSPTNVALSVFAEVLPNSLQAVTASKSFRDSVDIATVLINFKWRLKHFFTKQSREVSSISASYRFSPAFVLVQYGIGPPLNLMQCCSLFYTSNSCLSSVLYVKFFLFSINIQFR